MKILVYPKDSNPYQHLLYSEFPYEDDVTYLTHISSNNFISLMYLPIQIFFFRFCGFNIFHIHWLYTFRFRAKQGIFKTPPFKVFMTLYCSFILVWIKILRYKLVWTAHDLVPHSDYFLGTSQLTRLLSKLSSAIIMHSKSSSAQAVILGIDVDKIYLNKHGNYIGVYDNIISGVEARRKNGFKKKDFIFGLFGKVEAYKGVIELIQSFDNCNLKNAKLYIVGSCADLNFKEQVEKMVNKNNNIRIYLHFIKDDDIQYYMNCFDILVYPFKNITTSGSIILAMTFKKAVICPITADLADLPENTGIYYNNENYSSLCNAMELAYNQKLKLKQMGESGYKYIETLNWHTIAQDTRVIYKTLFN